MRVNFKKAKDLKGGELIETMNNEIYKIERINRDVNTTQIIVNLKNKDIVSFCVSNDYSVKIIARV